MLSLASLAVITSALAVPRSAVSNTSLVPGKAFDRIVFIWLENQDFEIAAGDRECLGFKKHRVVF